MLCSGESSYRKHDQVLDRKLDVDEAIEVHQHTCATRIHLFCHSLNHATHFVCGQFCLFWCLEFQFDAAIKFWFQWGSTKITCWNCQYDRVRWKDTWKLAIKKNKVHNMDEEDQSGSSVSKYLAKLPSFLTIQTHSCSNSINFIYSSRKKPIKPKL